MSPDRFRLAIFLLLVIVLATTAGVVAAASSSFIEIPHRSALISMAFSCDARRSGFPAMASFPVLVSALLLSPDFTIAQEYSEGRERTQSFRAFHSHLPVPIEARRPRGARGGIAEHGLWVSGPN